mmetsp:Transcript_1105/g.3355  ORF Transcript_1105/g.3355 Transcript_1105/m.3355 type:complete len:212 (-) Transcript_1105:232-867(-)
MHLSIDNTPEQLPYMKDATDFVKTCATSCPASIRLKVLLGRTVVVQESLVMLKGPCAVSHSHDCLWKQQNPETDESVQLPLVARHVPPQVTTLLSLQRSDSVQQLSELLQQLPPRLLAPLPPQKLLLLPLQLPSLVMCPACLSAPEIQLQLLSLRHQGHAAARRRSPGRPPGRTLRRSRAAQTVPSPPPPRLGTPAAGTCACGPPTPSPVH